MALLNIYTFFFGHIACGVFTEPKSLKGFHWILQNFSVLFLLGGIVGRLEFKQIRVEAITQINTYRNL